MKIDFSAPITNLSGEPGEENGVPVTLATLAINSLLMTLHDVQGQPERLPGVEKARLAEIAQRIHDEKVVDLKVEDVATVKDRIGKACQPLAVMQAWRLLENVS